MIDLVTGATGSDELSSGHSQDVLSNAVSNRERKRRGGGSSPPVSFAALDQNRDGLVSLEEFKGYFYFMFTKGVTTQKQPSLEAQTLSGIPDLFMDHDRDRDGSIQKEEFDAFWSL